ncbi:MAG: hypothetical protein Satyrvirus2_38 [Satyrvirus sp.]|uniref:Uncharacterized protein n=1 Tax=Satyrvirus sp. TaxID=2487771 RepID=A0A3G5ACZ2_9VIRU|nr:MAG: hypothetical protein Satyrvirus2_38 [Satyrvirus sp.]
MLKLFAGILCGVSLYSIYDDYRRRQEFNKNFMNTKKIDDKELIKGVITTTTGATTGATIGAHKKYPFFRKDIYVKKKIKFYDRYNIQNLYNIHIWNQKIIEYWCMTKSIVYQPNYTEINGTELVLNDNSKIYYTKNKIYNIFGDKKIIKRYIPNNSEIAILGKLNSSKYEADVIGSESDIINYVASMHGISNTKSIILFAILLLSASVVLY